MLYPPTRSAISSQPRLQFPMTEKITAVWPVPYNVPSRVTSSGVVNVTRSGAFLAGAGDRVTVSTTGAGAGAQAERISPTKIQNVIHFELINTSFGRDKPVRL